ncbi:MAG: DUF302 domain-containing protein [Pseudomonadota bacterium]
MKRFFGILTIVAGLGLGLAVETLAGTHKALKRDGWITHETNYSFVDLNSRLNDSIEANEMRRVTGASASTGAKNRGLTIPGNRIVGVYRNDFAVRMLEASLAAGIEAPIRYYVTENSDGTANLSYKTPTTVFSPYFDDGGKALKTLASELDKLFAKIANEAVK